MASAFWEGDEVGDNVFAILVRLRRRAPSSACTSVSIMPDERSGTIKKAIRTAVERIAALPAAERKTALAQLLILAGLRRLGRPVEEEARRMPILDSILDHEVLGREYKRGLHESELLGEVTVLRRQIEKRFGPLPALAEERLTSRSIAELEELSVRVLDAQSLEDLLK